MGESRPKPRDRRQSRRFSVRGWATIQRLPVEGNPIPASVRNLSAGGVCLDVARTLELGERTELLLYVNEASFRVAAMVREQSEQSGVRLQFVQIGQGAKDVLRDLIERLAKLQSINRKLRSGEIDKTMERKLLDTSRFRIVAIGEDERSLVVADDTETGSLSGESTPANEGGNGIVQINPRLIRIDLFG